MSLRDTIKAIQDRPQEDVIIPQWDITLRVMGMTAKEAFLLGEQSSNKELFISTLLAYSIVDDAGARLYTIDTVSELLDKSCDAVRLLMDAARRVNGFDQGAVKNG